MIAGLIIVPLVSVITPKLKKDDVDRIFSCYHEKVTVKHEMVLTDDEAPVEIK